MYYSQFGNWHALRIGRSERMRASVTMRHPFRNILIAALVCVVAGVSGGAEARSRIKDIVDFEGVRDNR